MGSNHMNLRPLLAVTCGVVAVLLIAACGDGPTSEDSAAGAQPPATAGPSTFLLSLPPTLTPASIDVETPSDASDYADDELPGIAQLLVDDFYGSDFERAAEASSSFCRPGNAGELTAMRESAPAAEVVAVERIANHGMIVFTLITADDTPPRTEAHLVVFEGGRWVNNDCDAGRAAVAFGLRLIPADEDAAGEDTFPTLSKPRFPELRDTPAEHSNELIARSAEASLTARVSIELAVPHPDLAAMRAIGDASCQSVVDEDLARMASETRKTLTNVSYSFRYHVNAVERIDANRAWVSALKVVDGDLRDPTPPTLFTYWKGRWRMADCPEARRDWPEAPETVPEILRVGLAGEPAQVQGGYREAPYAVTILGQPEQVNELMLRLPVRYASIVGKWSFDSATQVPARLALLEVGGSRSYWAGGECPGEHARTGQYVRGGWVDSHICFSPAVEPESEPVGNIGWPESWIEFDVDWLGGDQLERPVVIDLTQRTPIAPPARFENGQPIDPVDGIDERLRFIRWPISDDVPLRGYGDPVVVWGAYYWNSRETAALSGVEVFSSTIVRFRASITNKGLLFGTADRTGVVLTAFPDQNGRIPGVWSAIYEDDTGAPLADSFVGVDIERDESHEAYMYFRAPESSIAPTDGMPAILWVPDINGDYTPIYLDIDEDN